MLLDKAKAHTRNFFVDTVKAYTRIFFEFLRNMAVPFCICPLNGFVNWPSFTCFAYFSSQMGIGFVSDDALHNGAIHVFIQ
jgi:hypothetical protein